MKKYLILYAVATTALIIWGGKYLLTEVERLQNNNRALNSSVELFRTRADQAAASVQVLRLRVGEYEELRAADAEKIKSMGLKIRQLESAAKSVATTALSISTPLRDTVVVRDTLLRVDTLRLFRWNDGWASVEGVISADSVTCSLRTIDTLHQIVYRVPRRFLFFNYGTKALRQQITSSNPHSTIVYTEYIKIERRKR